MTAPDPLENFTLDDLLHRVRDDGSGCLIWACYADHGRFPMWSLDGSQRAVRRSLYRLVHGPIRPGMQVGVRCDQALCVHPDHLVARTRSRVQRGIKMPVMHRANITIARRSASKLTAVQIAEIQNSTASTQAEADRYGISRTQHHRIRTHRQWAQVTVSSPFTGLGAR